mgnify:CR=1 FL=1
MLHPANGVVDQDEGEGGIGNDPDTFVEFNRTFFQAEADIFTREITVAMIAAEKRGMVYHQISFSWLGNQACALCFDKQFIAFQRFHTVVGILCQPLQAVKKENYQDSQP